MDQVAKGGENRSSAQDRRVMLAGIGLAGAAIVGGLTRVAKAGDLNPPPGPIAPTGRTISQVYDRVASGGDHASPEPRRCVQDMPGSQSAMYVIDQPGAYYLSGNIQAQPGRACIEIRCDHVDLDGGGFTIVGCPGMRPAITCAQTTPPSVCRCIEIYDFAFRLMEEEGIYFVGCPDCFVSDCLFDQCVSPGDATGPGCVVRLGDNSEVCDCDVRDCEGSCISVGASSVVEDCTCRGGSGGAVRCGDGSCVRCVCVSNNGGGSPAISCLDRCEVCDCEMEYCTGLSVQCGSLCVLDGTRSHDCQGIYCGDGCCCTDGDITTCTGPGLTCGDRCCVKDFKWTQVSGPACVCGSFCVIEASECCVCSDGFQCASDCTLYDCEAHQCVGSSAGGGVGITCGDRCSISECDCRSCASAACVCGASCALEHCACCSCDSGYTCGADCRVTDCDAISCTNAGFNAGPRQTLCDCECRACGGGGNGVPSSAAVICASSCLVDGCVVSNCGGHAFVCADGCCCDDCDVSNCNGYAWTCQDRCSVSNSRALFCWGCDCAADCSVTNNELISCNGNGGGGGGGAISCRGSRCVVEDNTMQNCPLGIYVFGGAENCCCDANHCANCPLAILVDASVSRCLSTCNSATGAPPGASPFSFGATAYGPIIQCQGDISVNQLSHHPQGNLVY